MRRVINVVECFWYSVSKPYYRYASRLALLRQMLKDAPKTKTRSKADKKTKSNKAQDKNDKKGKKNKKNKKSEGGRKPSKRTRGKQAEEAEVPDTSGRRKTKK